MPVILATQEAEDQENRGSKPVLGKELAKSYLKITHHKKGLAEWLKQSE
jgi:hypothetical protein